MKLPTAEPRGITINIKRKIARWNTDYADDADFAQIQLSVQIRPIRGIRVLYIQNMEKLIAANKRRLIHEENYGEYFEDDDDDDENEKEIKCCQDTGRNLWFC